MKKVIVGFALKTLRVRVLNEDGGGCEGIDTMVPGIVSGVSAGGGHFIGAVQIRFRPGH